MEFVTCGVIRGDQRLTFPERLLAIHNGVCDVIDQFQPTVAGVEDVFVSVNPRSALKLGHARGAIIIAALKNGISVREYTARVVKQAVAGYGQASKAQVQQMVRALLSLSATPSQDASDALAVAMCTANHLGSMPLIL